MPMYGDYTARAQVSEAFSLASGLKVAIADFYAISGEFPKDNIEAGLFAPEQYETKYIESITITSTRSTSAASGSSNPTPARAWINVLFKDLSKEYIGSGGRKKKTKIHAGLSGRSFIIFGDVTGPQGSTAPPGTPIDPAAVLNWYCSENGDIKKYLPKSCSDY